VSPIFIVLGIFGLCEWFDRQRQRDSEQRLELLVRRLRDEPEAWEAEPYDWRRG
jgi:hypothetical protein